MLVGLRSVSPPACSSSSQTARVSSRFIRGWASHAGIIAAKLAIAGMTGPETALEGARGLYTSFAGDQTAARALRTLMDEFGTRWHIEDVAFKFVPCCHYLHPFVEASGLLADRGVVTDYIEQLSLRIAPGASAIVCEPWSIKQSPPDGHAARWSLPVVVAARLVEGRVDLDTFRRPPTSKVLALAGRCNWEPLEPNNFPRAFEAEISATLTDGRKEAVRIADVFGNASRPPQRADVIAKFRTNAELRLSIAAVRELERAVMSGQASLSAFSAAICETKRVS